MKQQPDPGALYRKASRFYAGWSCRLLRLLDFKCAGSTYVMKDNGEAVTLVVARGDAAEDLEAWFTERVKKTEADVAASTVQA